MKFDAIAIGQITSFLDFVSNGSSGIPQTDNDIISSFIGHLYMIFGDLLIDPEIRYDNSSIRTYSLIRYVDDIYIFLTFLDTVHQTEREIYISSLAARITDCLYRHLGLRLNTKTKLFWLEKQEDQKELLKNLKRVSPGYELADDAVKTDPNEKLSRVLRDLEQLKESGLDPTFNTRNDLDEEILKEVYNPSVGQLLRKKENIEKIHKIFDGFNFHLVIANSREILVVLLVDQDASEEFERFLLRKHNLTSRDVHLILNYLCQTGFQCNELIMLLKNSDLMKNVMEICSEKTMYTLRPGYFDLCDGQSLKVSGRPGVVEQIRLQGTVRKEKRILSCIESPS